MPNNNNAFPFTQVATCACGHSTVSVSARPFSRFKCHCTICQKLYQKPYADFVVLNAKDAELVQPNELEFAKYRLPPALKRGICSSCHSPLVGYLKLFPGLNLAFMPAGRFEDPSQLPEVEGHIFYHSRREDLHDGLPKYSGYWRSEFVVTKSVLKGLV